VGLLMLIGLKPGSYSGTQRGAEAPLFHGGGGVRGGSEITIKVKIDGGRTNASVATWVGTKSTSKPTSKASDRSVRPTRATDPRWQTAAE